MPVARLASDAEIVTALAEVFDSAPMLPTGQVIRRLKSLGLRLSAPPRQALSAALRTSHRPYYWLAGEEFLADGSALLAGCTFTHRVSAAELADDVLEVMPDFAPPMIDLLFDRGLRLPDGQHVSPFAQVPEEPVAGFLLTAQLPAGTLAGMGVRPGDLVGLSASASGCPELAPVGPPAVDELGPMLLRRLAPESAPIPVEAVVIAALARQLWPGGLQPPISQAAADAGLECDGFRIAPLGVPLSPVGGVGPDPQDLAEAYDLDRGQARAAAAALAVINSGELAVGELARSVLDDPGVADQDPDDPDGWVPEHLGEPARELLSGYEASVQEVLESHEVGIDQLVNALADPYLALVVAEEALEGFDSQAFGLALLVQLLDHSGLPRPARAAVDYLRGRYLELLEGAQVAEEAYRDCLAQAPEHSGALVSLAGIAVDRSQYRAARSLIDRSGVSPTHPLLMFLTESVENERHLGDSGGPAVPRSGRARNRPCPCGSGRKYKLCHGHPASQSQAVSAPEQAHRLYDKAALYCKLRHFGDLSALTQDVLDEGGAMAEGLIPTVLDALLFNDGVLEEYLELRGDLLSGTERDLIGAWLARSPSVFEVERCEPGQWLELRDLRTGERARVPERLASQQVQGQMLLYTRVADVGDGAELYGGVTVLRVHELNPFLDLLEADPDAGEIIGYLLDRIGPPTLVTPEGDPLELCTATFTTTAPVKLARELDLLFDRDSPGRWTVLADSAGGGDRGDVSRALAGLELAGRTLTLQTMSRARAAHAIELLDGAAAKLTQTSFEVADPASIVGSAGEPVGGSLPRTDKRT